MFNSLDTSASALVAQRQRMETISANLANSNSIYNAEGEYEPYRRRIAVFSAGNPADGSDRGVHIEEIKLDDAPLKKKYQPGHPEANEQGYVKYPNVNPVIEQVNALEASRAYEANITAAESTKSMILTSLTLLA